HANVKRSDTPEDHQRLTERATLRVLAKSDLVLKNRAHHWGSRRQPLDVYLVLMDGGLRLGNLGASDFQVWPPRPSLGQSQILLRLREARLRSLIVLAPSKHVPFPPRAVVPSAFDDLDLNLCVCHQRLGLRHFGFERRQFFGAWLRFKLGQLCARIVEHRSLYREIGLKIAVIQREQLLPLLDTV